MVRVTCYNSCSTTLQKNPKYVTGRGGPLPQEMVVKARALQIKEKVIYVSSCRNALDTIIYGLGGRAEDCDGIWQRVVEVEPGKVDRHEFAFAGKKIVVLHKLDNVRMKEVDPVFIQHEWLKHHPEEEFAPEANTCMKTRLEVMDFEGYDEEFHARIVEVFDEIVRRGEEVAIVSHKEVMRHIMLLGKPTGAFRETQLFKEMAQYKGPIERGHFDTPPSSLIEAELGQGFDISLIETNGVIFRHGDDIPAKGRSRSRAEVAARIAELANSIDK